MRVRVRAIESIDTFSDRERSVVVVSGSVPLEAISSQELRNEVDRLERTPDAVIPPRRYCSLLVACTNGKLRARILRLADKVMDLSAAESAAHGYGLIFHVLRKSRVVQRRELDSLIATILSTMRDQDVSVNEHGLNHLLNLYISYGDVAKACDLFDLLREGEGRWRTQPNVITYTTLIRGLAGRADANVRPNLPRALAYFDQMLRDGLQPDRMAFTALLHVCAEADDLPRALQVWGNMKRAGVAPDTFTFNSLIHACHRALDLNLALKFMGDMQSPKWGQLTPDDVTYSSLIDLCCWVNDFVRAHELLNEMKERGIAPTVYTFSSLISGYAVAGDVERCYDVLVQMDQERVRPNHVTLVSLVNACLNAGDFRKAVETLGNMKRQYNLAPNRHTLHLLISKAGPQAKTSDLVPTPACTRKSLMLGLT
jgi:pentatricopeptide repeat protein